MLRLVRDTHRSAGERQVAPFSRGQTVDVASFRTLDTLYMKEPELRFRTGIPRKMAVSLYMVSCIVFLVAFRT